MRTGATGLRAWAMQRVTAIYLGVLVVWLLGHFLTAPPADYPSWRSWVGQPVIAIALELGFVSLLLHAWIGVRDILIDYVHPPAIRLGMLFLFGFALTACGIWSLQVITRASLT